jgi:hypothetical protein
MRSQSKTLLEIAQELGVSKSSVSVWCRDVEFVPKPRNRGHPTHKPHPLTIKKLAELEQCRNDAAMIVGSLSARDLTMFALALYAGEGAKGDGSVIFANSDVRLMLVFLTWLRQEFEIDESRLRIRLYLHADLDVEQAMSFWSASLGIPTSQFNKPYRAVVDATIRTNRHVNGCASIVYSSTFVHRRVMAAIEAVTSAFAIPG